MTLLLHGDEFVGHRLLFDELACMGVAPERLDEVMAAGLRLISQLNAAFSGRTNAHQLRAEVLRLCVDVFHAQGVGESPASAQERHAAELEAAFADAGDQDLVICTARLLLNGSDRHVPGHVYDAGVEAAKKFIVASFVAARRICEQAEEISRHFDAEASAGGGH